MFAYIAAFLSPFSYAVTNVVDSHISNNVFKRMESVIFYCVITNILVIPFLFLFGMPKIPPLSLVPFILLAAILEVLYLVPYYMAMRNIDTSITSALFCLGKVFVPVFAFFLVEEKISILQYLGFGIIIASGIALSVEKDTKIRFSSAFWLMLTSSILASLLVVVEKKVLMQIGWVSNVFWMSLLTASFVLILLVSKSNRVEIFDQYKEVRSRCSLFMLNEFFNQLGVICANYALTILPVIVYTGITSTQPIFVLLISFLLSIFSKHGLKERFDKWAVIKKLVCFIFMIIGIILAI